MQREHISRISTSDESLNSSSSRVLIHSAKQTSEHTLPISITSSPSTTQRTTQTQTIQQNPSSFRSKSVPSFAETQLLSVYYPSQNPKNPSTNDKCIFVEQQDRQPIRYRTKYDPSASTKSTQTSPPSTPLSTYGSTLIIDRNKQIKSNYEQHLKIHSGSQNLSNNIQDEHALPNELIEESRYSYEEYIVHLDKKKPRTASSSSSSSVTTVIAQNEKPNQRISSWPPVPDDIIPIDNDEQKRSSRVQFAEQIVHVIPPSTTNSEDSITPPPVIPRTIINGKNSSTGGVDPCLVHDKLQRLDYHPINQSKWVKTHMNNSEVQTNSPTNRVDALRSIFEQQTSRSSDSSTLNSPTNQIRRTEPEEKPSKHGVEIRFRVNDKKSSSIHHAEPAKVIQHSTKQEEHSPSSKLDQIRQITGKQIKSLDDVGHYLQVIFARANLESF